MDDDSLATVIPFPRDRAAARRSVVAERSVEEPRAPEDDWAPEDYWALVQRLREERRRLATRSG